MELLQEGRVMLKLILHTLIFEKVEKQFLIKKLIGPIECEAARTHVVIQEKAGLELLKGLTIFRPLQKFKCPRRMFFERIKKGSN